MRREVLDYTKLHSGSMPYDFSPAALQDIVESATVAIAGQASAKHVRLTCSLNEGERRLMVDARRIRQVLLNLTMNAIESMAAIEGRRLLTVTSEAGPDGVTVSVTDNGLGFDEDRIDQLFEALVTTKPHGMGMGLSISKSIVDAHGGNWESSQLAELAGVFAGVIQVAVPAEQEEDLQQALRAGRSQKWRGAGPAFLANFSRSPEPEPRMSESTMAALAPWSLALVALESNWAWRV